MKVGIAGFLKNPESQDSGFFCWDCRSCQRSGSYRYFTTSVLGWDGRAHFGAEFKEGLMAVVSSKPARRDRVNAVAKPKASGSTPKKTVGAKKLASDPSSNNSKNKITERGSSKLPHLANNLALQRDKTQVDKTRTTKRSESQKSNRAQKTQTAVVQNKKPTTALTTKSRTSRTKNLKSQLAATTAISKRKSASHSDSHSPRKPSSSFQQRLGTLTYSQACTLLGQDGKSLLAQGGQIADIVHDRDVFLGHDLLRFRIADPSVKDGVAIVTLTSSSVRQQKVAISCSICDYRCLHQGAALDYLLECKSALGLAMPPDEKVPLELLTRDELMQRVHADRKKRATEEKMQVRSQAPDQPWTDYVVTSHISGRTYRTSIRGFEPTQSYCTCPDFRTNLVQTCKHVLHVQERIKKRFSAAELKRPYRRQRLSVSLSYGQDFGLVFNLPHAPTSKMLEIVEEDRQPLTDARLAMNRITALEQSGEPVHIYPDAEAYIQRQLVQAELQKKCQDLRSRCHDHPLRSQLLKATLMPYQLDGIAFCVAAGRAILADDMGLGKTIQSIGVAELLAKLANIRRVLIVCPASLKSQWQSEIHRFSDRSTQIVMGTGVERSQQYAGSSFFTICNYEQVIRDLTPIEEAPWDLIILDEGQRIKNWESRTSNVIRQLQSPFRLVLSGTPLENRLGELFTVVRFADERLLGPAYEFFHKHHIVDEGGKTLAYHRLQELRDALKPILLRRTRDEVAKQLPKRTDELVLIEPTEEQREFCYSQMKIVSQIMKKPYLTEMDMLRVQKALLMARMVCDSTFLIDQKEPEYSSKLERLHELLEGLLADPTRKIVLFSEWRRMLDRIELRLAEFGVDWVRLDGQIPQKNRGAIVEKFQTDENCRVILMTNAGSTGLNLQAANTVINVDLPWNPAVLEQRIARAYRMGQKQPVHVYKLVTTGETIEHRMLDTLATKQELANAAIEMTSDVQHVEMTSGMEDLKQRLEVVLSAKPVFIDKSQENRVVEETVRLAEQRQKVSEASGQLVSAALSLAGQLLSQQSSAPADANVVSEMTRKLSESLEKDEQGRPQLKITLPDESALKGLAETLARLLG